MPLPHHSSSRSDAALLDILTGPAPQAAKSAFARRDAALDPLLIAAAAASGPHVTRNHYHHDFFPGVMLPQAEGAWDWTKYTGEDSSAKGARKHLAYVSRQAPRRQRLGLAEEGKENDHPREIEPLKSADNLPPASKKRRPSLASSTTPINTDVKARPKAQSHSDFIPHSNSIPQSLPPVEVKCMARTRIPTPHGPAFLHLYHNNRDSKEHLAVVIDPAQLSDSSGLSSAATPIRSRSLDAVWSENETEMDRIIRGAYVGRLSSTSKHASDPTLQTTSSSALKDAVPPPIIRIHSECFTGETIGSMRCDCGEQLDEAIRQISLPIVLPPTPQHPSEITIPGRGAIIYLRQEGRGIGLLSKIRAYNLQDMGHDTVTANLMLGHKADERGYEIAAAILRDLNLGTGSPNSVSEGVRVLTNNPDKVEALQKEGIQVAERVPMIPRSWQHRKAVADASHMSEDTDTRLADGRRGPTDDEKQAMADLGSKTVYGDDLDKYLRTKILRMGHMLPLWMEEPDVTTIY
ncbi:putative GTP cyclohydrolase-2 [Psilocybe cubensis]|uniref:GTP cyclohydrolase II n=2 Tax=Psilocybe cubensis TaxID=181762 RepID=A0A8H8CLT7_PSICU|nr:putative GTP cyclohydrolase-2 [Psilocybe cubensis]KAH9482791.1 putative GTP cyclohydrolase-2 [Psilocybe cubensis]